MSKKTIDKIIIKFAVTWLFWDSKDRAEGCWMLGIGADGGGMMSCSAHPSRPLTRHRICSIAEGGN